jgi:hypothetical protein
LWAQPASRRQRQAAHGRAREMLSPGWRRSPVRGLPSRRSTNVGHTRRPHADLAASWRKTCLALAGRGRPVAPAPGCPARGPGAGGGRLSSEAGAARNGGAKQATATRPATGRKRCQRGRRDILAPWAGHLSRSRQVLERRQCLQEARP